jgi:hypothetical protein
MPPYLLIQYLWITVARNKIWKLNKLTVHKFQTAHQVRTCHHMVKSSSPNVPSTWLIFLCPCSHATLQNLPPFCFSHSRCSHQLPHYRNVCIQKAYIYINKIYHIYVCYTENTLHSVWYYPWFYITKVGLWTYYLWIQGHWITLTATTKSKKKKK